MKCPEQANLETESGYEGKKVGWGMAAKEYWGFFLSDVNARISSDIKK